MIIFRPFERSRTASISARSASERRNLNTLRLSSGCSDTPRRVPFWVWKGGGSSQPSQAKSLIDSRNEVEKKGEGEGRLGQKGGAALRSGVEKKNSRLWGKGGRSQVDAPTRTAPTKEWSRTHRTATFAMVAPPCRSPIFRNTARSCWNKAQSPHARVMASKYCWNNNKTRASM